MKKETMHKKLSLKTNKVWDLIFEVSTLKDTNHKLENQNSALEKEVSDLRHMLLIKDNDTKVNHLEKVNGLLEKIVYLQKNSPRQSAVNYMNGGTVTASNNTSSIRGEDDS